MKYKVVFLLGRPGCGKSALYHELEKRILASGQAKSCERVDDFPKLWARLAADDALEREGKERVYSRRTDDGGYGITYDDFFDELLREVNSDVLQIDRPEHMVFVEFARNNYVEGLSNFDQSILDGCLVVYMEVSFETCWQRNVARHRAKRDQGGDDHMVCRESMEELYLYDDQEALVEVLKDQGIPVVVVNNEASGEEHLEGQVEELWQHLF